MPERVENGIDIQVRIVSAEIFHECLDDPAVVEGDIVHFGTIFLRRCLTRNRRVNLCFFFHVFEIFLSILRIQDPKEIMFVHLQTLFGGIVCGIDQERYDFGLEFGCQTGQCGGQDYPTGDRSDRSR